MNCELAAAQEQEVARTDLQWFQDAKLGIFIHWGIYSVRGVGRAGASTMARSRTANT